jgi:hypothetical protein
MMGKYVGLADSLQLKGQNMGAQSNLSLDAFSLFAFSPEQRSHVSLANFQMY